MIPQNILNGIDTYLTSSTCLNQSANIFLQPSPFEAIELIIYTLKYSQRPVDILVLGTMTNLAAAITRDRSIVSKIGTLYFSGMYASISILLFICFHIYSSKLVNLNHYQLIRRLYQIQV